MSIAPLSANLWLLFYPWFGDRSKLRDVDVLTQSMDAAIILPLGSVVVDGRRAKTPARQYPLKPIPGANVPPTPTQLPTYPGGFRGQPPQQMPNYASPVGVPPSSPQQPGQFGRFNAVPGPVPGPPGQQPPQRLASVNQGAYGSQRHDKKSSHKKHHQQPQLTPQQQAQVLAQQQAQAQEDAEEPSGDELDFLTARDVAIARYRRNHDYIAEVFSPYSTGTSLCASVAMCFSPWRWRWKCHGLIDISLFSTQPTCSENNATSP